MRISETDVPRDLRWDVPPGNAGQIVEVAYAAYPASAGEADVGDPYRRVTDQSCAINDPERACYYKRVVR